MRFPDFPRPQIFESRFPEYTEFSTLIYTVSKIMANFARQTDHDYRKL